MVLKLVCKPLIVLKFFNIDFNILLTICCIDLMDLLSNVDDSQWKNEEPKNIQGRFSLAYIVNLFTRDYDVCNWLHL